MMMDGYYNDTYAAAGAEGASPVGGNDRKRASVRRTVSESTSGLFSSSRASPSSSSKKKQHQMQQQQQQQPRQHASSRRHQRRASTGGYTTMPLPGPPPQVDDLGYSGHSRSTRYSGAAAAAAAAYGYGVDHDDDDTEAGDDDNDHPSYMKVLRRASISKVESEAQLRNQLGLVNDYQEAHVRDEKLQKLKDQFSGSKRNMKRVPRRSSISSYASAASMASNSESNNNNYSTNNNNGSNSNNYYFNNNTSNREPSSANSTRESLGVGTFSSSDNVSVALEELQHASPRKVPGAFHPNMSSETLPMTNIVKEDPEVDRKKRFSAKTDQIIESLVWFSFHTPRTVLEDLITHEMEIWQRDHEQRQRAAAARAAAALSSGGEGASPRAGMGRSCHSLRRSKSRQAAFAGLLNGSRHTRSSQASSKKSKASKSSKSLKDHDEDDETDVNVVVEEDVDRSNANNESDDDDEGSLSSLSDEEGANGGSGVSGPGEMFDGNFSSNMLRWQGMMKNGGDVIALPKAVERESALLFVDMSGFTKLSTMLDVESLSKVINSYFDMIVGEVIQHGGDVLKFCGDAFFAEWKVVSEVQPDPDDEANSKISKGANGSPLAELNASLASINDMHWDDDDEDAPKLAQCVLSAAKCAVSIVKKYSDYHVTSASANTSEAMLNVHCGVGVGHLVGLHVGDYKEDQEEDGVELRREFLILGDPIEQVSKAADLATDGEVYASPEALTLLAHATDMARPDVEITEPVCIASRDESFLSVDTSVPTFVYDNEVPAALQPYESLQMHCKALNRTALARLHLQMALYVHPVIRGDELALSAAIQAGKISQPTEALESRHRAEAELRSVFTIFIKAVLSPRITGMKEIDEELYNTLGGIMHVTSRELDRYSGHLRQFVVDDKGVVLIATFGLRGSTFPNMVANNCLPATFAIHRALKSELNVENRIGATYGKVYCGVVGGVRRHEFAVMGAPVNLAARLMASKVNKGILVDEAVREQAGSGFAFRNLKPVSAKGYDKPVPIFEPLHVVNYKKKKSTFPFIGRNLEKVTITSAAFAILQDPFGTNASMVFIMGESGMGKSALAREVVEEIRKKCTEEKKYMVAARSTSTETEQRIPLSSYRKVFLSFMRDFVENERGGHRPDDESKWSTGSRNTLSAMMQRSPSRRLPLKDSGAADNESRRAIMGKLRSKSDDVDSDSDEAGDDVGVLWSQSRRHIDETSPEKPPRSQAKNGKKYLPHALSLNHTIHGMDADELSTSLHRGLRADSPRRSSLGASGRSMPSPDKSQSMRHLRQKPSLAARSPGLNRDDSSAGSLDMSTANRTTNASNIPYFEKLCWVCEQLSYPYEYADIVGSQFLGLENARDLTAVDGHVPSMDELVEFLAMAFITIVDCFDLSVVILDDFQWMDAFSWKIFRVLSRRGKKMLFMCATRSHDKQALRRMSQALAKEDQLQSQTIEVTLGPLDFPEIRELVACVLGQDASAVTDSLCTDIFQRTGGLPVYVIQVVENIKRKKTLELKGGVLEWNAEGLKEKRLWVTNSSGAVMMEATFLSRFDTLDVRVRKVLQTCAVLGLSFSLSDVIQVHPEMEESDIESALDNAVEEMILFEQVEDDGDEGSLRSGSTDNDTYGADTKTSLDIVSDAMRASQDRFFQFSHAMWRKNVLATMLKERKIELHRLIAESMEKDTVLILDQSDISRLLTLFEHWKACGDFCKSAPLALAVGARLEEWDLSSQSLELYEDALELSFDSVETTTNAGAGNEDWVQVKARPVVLDLILRLHICIGLCHQRLGDADESVVFFEDAYNIIKTASKIPGMSKSLMMPVISSLSVLKLEKDTSDPKIRREQEKLLRKFVEEAQENGSPVHVTRALAMEASLFVRIGKFQKALENVKVLENVYSFDMNSVDMIAEYGRDFGIECLAEKVHWLYLSEKHKEAEEHGDMLVEMFVPQLDPSNTDDIMYILLPVLEVYRLIGRAKDAEMLLKKFVINPYHEFGAHSAYWTELFNPLAYLLEVIRMEESEVFDSSVLEGIEEWVLEDANGRYGSDMERRAHTYMGELCWRLAYYKEDVDPQASSKLLARAKELLEPVARHRHNETFTKHTARALLKAL